jgi:EAL domain-containing protein (putative c-di-GMP-specific phosphodiesterase class I)
LIPPAQFIPFAEQTGFIHQMTIWVFDEAASPWKMLLNDGLRLLLSVNLSTRDLLDTKLPQKFEALFIKHRVPAQAFCLEITESAIMDDPQRALGTLNDLSGLGFKLSVDDFGTGHSSLAYLKKLPVDELKIDPSFVLNMETDSDDAKIFKSTVDLAQGFHMGEPMPVEAFAAWSVAWLVQPHPKAANAALLLH